MIPSASSRCLPLLLLTGLLVLPPAISAQTGGVWMERRLRSLPTDKLGPFVRTTDDKILALDSTVSYVSDDAGRTWAKRPLSGAIEKGIKVSNERAMLRTKSGVVIAAFMNLNERKWTWKNELHDAPGAKLPTYVMRSLDNGQTWIDVQKMHDDWSGAVRDMIQTKDGRIIFTAMKMQHDPGRHAVLTYSSMDDGKTWKASNLIDLGGKGHHGGVTEPTLTELKDGSLWMLIRTNWGEFWTARSHDGGRFWRVLKPSGIPASSAPGFLKRLRSGRLLLVWNRPYPEGRKKWKLSGGDGLWSETPVSNHRDELSLSLSEDEGKTWSDPVVIARTPIPSTAKRLRWIAYPYVFEHRPGELWLTTMQGGLRAQLREHDFIAEKAVPIDRLPFRIRRSGVYRLSRDLDFSPARGQAISVESDDVTIDLDGRTLRGSAGAGTLSRGIHANNRKNITITNGRVAGFYFGIDLRNDSRPARADSGSHLVADVALVDNWYFGMRVMGSGCEVRACEISNTGGSTRPKHTIPHGARLVGARNVMRDCCIRNLRLKRFSNGTGEIVGVHFDAAKDSLFERNRVLERIDKQEAAGKTIGDPTERRFGLWINGGPQNDTKLTVRNNTFAGFTVPIVFAPGADGSATDNTFHQAAARPVRGKLTGEIRNNRRSDIEVSISCAPKAVKQQR